MKKIIGIILCFFVAMAIEAGSMHRMVQSRNAKESASENNDGPTYLFEATGGVLWPTQSKLQNIYGKVWPTFQAKGSFAFAPGDDSVLPMYGWMAIGYTEKSGRSIGAREKTKVRMIPLSVGIRIIKSIDSDDIVFFNCGVGIQACFTRFTNQSNFVPMDIHKVAPAGVIDIGLYLRPMDYFFFSGTFDYTFGKVSGPCSTCNANVVTTSLKINNASLRLGLGVIF